MVRRRVELRKIEDKAKRTASFSKRRTGLLKKAKELAVLCDAEVGVIVFSPTGKLSCFSSHSSIETTIQHFYEFSDAEKGVKKHALESKSCCKGLNCQEINNGIPETAQRLADQQTIVHLNEKKLDRLEKELNKGLRQKTYKKVYKKPMIDAIAKSGLDLKLPTCKDIYGRGLNGEYVELQQYVDTFKIM